MNDTVKRLALGLLSSDSLDDIQGVRRVMRTGQDRWLLVSLEKLESPEADPEARMEYKQLVYFTVPPIEGKAITRVLKSRFPL